MANKKKFGSMASCGIKYVICVFFPTKGKYKFVSKVQCYPHKYCEWKDKEKAVFFETKKVAEDICFGLNVNGTSCFVMEVPDFFKEEDFVNPVLDKE